jgi:type II secretory pathway pseudopilin PulG
MSRRQRGSTYAIALIVLLVLGTLATMLGWSALMQTQHAQRKEVQLRLNSLLQSGVTYARWTRSHQGRNLPYTFTLNLSEGRVTGRVDPANQHGKNAMRIQVTATYKDQSQSLTRIVDGSQKARSTTEFALFVDEDLVVPSGKKLVLQGDLHSNRNVRVQPGGTLQVGGAVSASHQLIGSITATLYEEQYGRLVPNDLPSLSELYTLATQLLVGNQTLPFGLTLSNGTVYYVLGNLRLQGTLRGSAIVVVEGNLDFTGNTSYADPDSLYVFFVEGNIRVPTGRSVVGLLISLDGDVVLEDRAQVRGGIIILDGSLQLQGESVIEHDPRINTNLFQELTKMSDVINGIPLIPIPIVP